VHDAGVADQHVDAAELGDGGIDHRAHLRRSGHVGTDGDGAPAEPAHLGDRLFGGPVAAQRRIAVLLRRAGDPIDLGDGDVRPRPRQCQRDAAADAAAAAGNECYLVF